MSQNSDASNQSGTVGSYGPATGSLPPRRRRGRRLGIIALLLATLLLILILLFFLPRPTANVTLTSASKALNDSGQFTVTARELHSAQQGTQSGVTTSHTRTGLHANGMLTFKNYTFSWVTIPKGTIVTNNTGQQVATEKDLRVPPDPIVPGIASVSAHSVKTGTSGNIAAMSINKLYKTGVNVVNDAAYSGGLDDSTVYTIQQSNIDAVANALIPSLIQKAHNAIQAQLQSGERLVNLTTSKCPAKVTSKPIVGTNVTKFTVTVSLICSNSAYNPQTAVIQEVDQLKQKAAQELGPGFNLIGNITNKIEKTTPDNHGSVNLLISASGTWKYQFTAVIKSNMAKHIARETVTDAKTWLLQQTGVSAVSISVTGPIIDLNGGNKVPDDLRAITING